MPATARLMFRCPHCEETYGVPESYAGQRALCARCKAKVQVPERAEPPERAAAQPALPRHPGEVLLRGLTAGLFATTTLLVLTNLAACYAAFKSDPNPFAGPLVALIAVVHPGIIQVWQYVLLARVFQGDVKARQLLGSLFLIGGSLSLCLALLGLGSGLSLLVVFTGGAGVYYVASGLALHMHEDLRSYVARAGARPPRQPARRPAPALS